MRLAMRELSRPLELRLDGYARLTPSQWRRHKFDLPSMMLQTPQQVIFSR